MKGTRTGLLIFVMFIASIGLSQTISGRILDQKNEPLPYATIQILDSDQGAVSNQEGYFLLHLKEGRYQFRFQYVGYRTRDTTIELTVGLNRTLNVKLNQEAFTLPTVTVDGRDEDPAYTIMRRAIGKASYHANQIDAYQAKVYIKGSGRLLKVPFLFKNKIKKELAKEGIDSTVAFAQESVSRLYYKRPGQYRDTVLSMRSSGDDNNTSPNQFVYSSFYEPKVGGSISPLSPNAFQIYTFEYLGYIEEHGAVINKIKVIPRGRGDQVFEGTLYITDQVWSIHSLDLSTSIWGIQFGIKQIFSPIQENVWMPIDQIYDVNGNVFGFGFSYKYLAHLSEYKVKLNQDINLPLVILDDKKNKEESEVANKKINSKPNPLDVSGLQSGQELSAKQLRKMMKEYKKKEIEQMPERDTVSIALNESTQVIDSLANKRDSNYWAEVRPVVLTTHEIKGYTRMDSLSKVEKKKEEPKKNGDSTALAIGIGSNGAFTEVVKTYNGFKLIHLLFGAQYNYNQNHQYFKILPTISSVNFNTVDGYHARLGIEVGNKIYKDHQTEWKLRPEMMYAFSREVVNYKATATLQNLSTKNGHLPWAWNVAGGHYREAFGSYLSSESYLNTIYSMLFKKNYLKLYDQSFLKTKFQWIPSKAWTLSTQLEWADRSPLTNSTNYSFFNRKKIYTENKPDVPNLSNASLRASQAFITEIEATWIPFYRYKTEYGYKSKDRSVSPSFTFQFRKGWSVADAPFNLIKLDIKHHIHIGAGDDVDYKLSTGTFVGKNKPAYFQDYAHFPGNRYIFSPLQASNNFRLLDYYSYSTNKSFVSLLGNYQFRRLLFTTSPWVRKKGIRENVIFNALATPDRPLYGELGYSINYLFRVFRIEAVTSWDQFKYKDFGLRIGIATGFENLFKF